MLMRIGECIRSTRANKIDETSNLCRVLFKQRHKTQEKAKTRESIRKKNKKKIENDRNNEESYLPCPYLKKKITYKESVGGDQMSNEKNMVRWDTSREFQFSFSLNLIKEEKIVFLSI